MFDIISKKFDIDLRRNIAFIDIAIMEATINAEESEYKCMVESTNDSNLQIMLEEVNDTLVDKFKKSVNNIITSIKAFFTKVLGKITSIFSKTNNDALFSSIDTKLKNDPSLKNEKITINGKGESGIGELNKCGNKIKSFISKIKGGKVTDSSEIDDINDEFNKKHAAILAGTITLTVGAAYELLKKRVKTVAVDIDDHQKDILRVINELNKKIPTNPDSLKVHQQTINVLSKYVTNTTTYETTLLAELKNGIMNKLK